MLICPVCGNTEWVKVYQIDQWEIGQCNVCCFARIDPMPTKEIQGEHYSKKEVIKGDSKKRSSSHGFSRACKQLFNKVTKRNKAKIFYDKLVRYLPPKSRVLDVGCGGGSFIKFAKNQFQCTGIEVSEYLADVARQDGDIEVIVGDFLTTDLLDKKYEAITMISIIEHLEDPLKAVMKCYHHLTEGGVLLIKTVNYGCLNRKIQKGKWPGFRPPNHVVHFTPANLKRFLKKAGFSKMKFSAWTFNDNMYCDAWK